MNDTLRRRLEAFEPLYVKIERPREGEPKSGKRAIERAFQLHPYHSDDPTLLDWIESGGNYAVLCGRGIIGLDLDTRNMEGDELVSALPPTLKVESGSGKGLHLYFRSDVNDNAVIFDADGNNVGNVQARYKYLVAPGSKHWTGGEYVIIEDLPVEWLSMADLEEIIKGTSYNLQWSSKGRQRAEGAAEDEATLIGHVIPIEDIIDLDQLKEKARSEYQGEHPLHGSTTGQNFTVNTDKNVWHCFRCNSGGGPLLWLAVREGLIKCAEAQRGTLVGELFIETLDLARSLGFPIKMMGVPEALPPSALKYFSKRMSFIPKRLADDIIKDKNIFTLASNIFLYDPDAGIYRDRGDYPIYCAIYRRLGEAYRDVRAREVIKIIKFETAVDEMRELSPELIAVENGLLNVLTKELMPFAPDAFVTVKLPVVYDPAASSDAIEGFVAQVVSKDDGETLQEFSGYCLLKDHPYRKGAALHGPTQSGKTTFMETLRAMLGGPQNVASTQLHSIISNRFAAASLYGKLGNFAPELDEREIRYTGQIKALMGGDTFTAERKGQDSFQFMNYSKQLYTCNDLPKVSIKESTAFFNRFELIAFPNQFLGRNADRSLGLKLKAPEALSGMLNWALEGLQRLVARGGFRVKMSTEAVKERYIARADPAKFFVENYLERDRECKLSKGETYGALDRMCMKYGAFTPSKRRLGMEMKDAGFHEAWDSKDGKRRRCWAGVKLREDDEPIGFKMVREQLRWWA